mmetsp:Transcript_12370/g.13578  ORF Transcript_12370/g.13578 Transcript_12370/m.13578 type:complete len:85 (+) Transcript_12370:253-507(+)
MTSKGRDNSTTNTIKASLYDDHHNQNKAEDPYHQLSLLAADFVSTAHLSTTVHENDDIDDGDVEGNNNNDRVNTKSPSSLPPSS